MQNFRKARKELVSISDSVKTSVHVGNGREAKRDYE